VRLPNFGPLLVGTTTICMVQAEYATRVMPPVLLPGFMAKFPESAMLRTESGDPSLFDKVAFCAVEVRPTPVPEIQWREWGERYSKRNDAGAA
jgi:hypothetical protein